MIFFYLFSMLFVDDSFLGTSTKGRRIFVKRQGTEGWGERNEKAQLLTLEYAAVAAAREADS